MTEFEIHLKDLEESPVDVDIDPTAEQLDELFEDVQDDFEVLSDRDFHIDLYAFLDDDTVVINGTLDGVFAYTCGRCLEDREFDVDSEVDVALMSREAWAETYEGADEIALEEEDMDVTYYDGERIDLRPLIRETILLDLPTFPQCPPELREECDAAYERNVGDDTLEEQEEREVDLRWWPLKDIELDDDEGEDDEG